LAGIHQGGANRVAEPSRSLLTEALKMYRLPASLLLSVLLGACAAPQTLVQSIDAPVLSAASTFAIDPPPLGTTGSANPNEAARLRAAIEGEITRVLGSKGYEIADPESADLKVAYRLAFMGRLPRNEREDAVAESRVATGPGDPYGTYRPLPEAAEGERPAMLLVTITDRKSSAIVWQATNEGLATSTASAVGEVSRATRAALAKVPTAQRRRP
jgi:hypothetical protein